ncbi:hypothetical protein ABFV80_002081 [Vandammella animalimorsus]|uniref:hypothetical protein n=1 Tax=Vandammella animalimorsus TaxID=2029117 RepID=UPI00325C2433
MKNISLSATALLVAACASQAQPIPTPEKATQTMKHISCKNLEKIKDIDDLLYQMHSNLDSQCLFKIPAKDLESIWGIRVFGGDTHIDWSDSTTAMMRATEIREYSEKENSLYIIRQIYFDDKNKEKGEIIIGATIAYRANHNGGLGGSLSTASHFPTRLPPPNSIDHTPENMVTQPHPIGDFRSLPDTRDIPMQSHHSEYRPRSRYRWFHIPQNNNYPYLEIQTFASKTPEDVRLHLNGR